MRLRLLALFLVFAAASARADCSDTAPRRASASTAGITRVVVIGRAGSLRVTGRAEAREIVASGTACADSKGVLADIQLRAQQNGSELRIEAVIPEHSGLFGWSEARLDFEVTLPNSLALEVRDGSGEAVIENVGDLKVVDGSGELTIRGVHGNADVTDGSGALTISDVGGDLKVSDGSGGIEIRNIGRNVTIRDGSGGIEVSDVRGDFTVTADGSGGIDYDRIGGKVSVPRRHRD